MADKITMQVTRYRPEEESSATVQEYEVPCPKDWVVLDGLKPGDSVIIDNVARLRPGAAVAPKKPA